MFCLTVLAATLRDFTKKAIKEHEYSLLSSCHIGSMDRNNTVICACLWDKHCHQLIRSLHLEPLPSCDIYPNFGFCFLSALS